VQPGWSNTIGRALLSEIAAEGLSSTDHQDMTKKAISSCNPVLRTLGLKETVSRRPLITGLPLRDPAGVVGRGRT